MAALRSALGDLDRAEDAAQEAFAVAAARWPVEGVPASPRAWLVATARNRAVDGLRRERAFTARAPLLAAPEAAEDEMPHDDAIPDERLELIFGCCHPALATEAQVALTLRALCGLGTAEIARAFLVPEATMAKRLVRAKHKISAAGIPFEVPAGPARRERLAAVLGVVYLVFTRGFGAERGELAEEAIGLGRALADLLPGEAEVHGLLLALMLLHEARRGARVVDGELVLLADQDPALFDAGAVAEGEAALARATAIDGTGPYALQAAIAALHARVPRDRARIAGLYEALALRTGSPVVALAHAIAVAEAGDPARGLAMVDRIGLDEAYHYVHAARAELNHRLGRVADARAGYDRALELVGDDAERRLLARRRAELG